MSIHFAEHHPDADESVLFLHGGSVAGWSWTEQAKALPDHHSLLPDLPGFGASAHHAWTDLSTTADELADLVRERGHGGQAHVVGLSLGGVVGTALAARHPDVIRSVFVTGAILQGLRGFARWAGLAQIPLFGSTGYWKTMAKVYRLPPDAVDVFVETGVGIDRDSISRMVPELYDGVPARDLDGLRRFVGPFLAIVGEKEPRVIRDAMSEVTSRVPHAVARLAPGMHHVWDVESPELFHTALAHWLTTGEPSPALLPVAPG
ncbi:alpha/beta fold hydrolase [Promicromonospora sp. CA-289599]|uniref:alpha/beta fold hydrolase n=1 Tax=Promicromonospora sp. CA-289599 TaxID=3240014 RepID=UPI003D9111A2